MSRPSDIRLRSISASTKEIAYRTPMKFGGRVVTSATLLNVDVEVETRAGPTGRGHGSMPLGNVWAWPSATLSAEGTLAAMKELGRRYVAVASDVRGWGHPLELTHHFAEARAGVAGELQKQLGLSEAIPPLAQLVVASPIEAAIYDAQGKALGRNCYDLLGPEYVAADLSEYLGPDFRGEHLDRYTLRSPKPKMPLYHLVGALDPLTPADVAKPVGDGLPETLGEWIRADGLTHLKIKLNGDDLGWDVNRVLSVDAVAGESRTIAEPHHQQGGSGPWHYSLDFNERCPNVEYVIELLRKIDEVSPAALRRVQYIEQPTHRDLRAHPENRMHKAAQLKPVVIDESLIDLESLLLSREMGYSGVALKACKGHSEALLMGAAAQKYGMYLCVQDLTCPGASFLHSCTLAARIPTVTAIEGNARQYCPAGNVDWADRYPSMFQISDGTVGTASLDGAGLGF